MKSEDPVEKGDIDVRGHEWTYGGAIINHASHINQEGEHIDLSTMLQVLLDHQEHLKTCQVERIYLTLNFFHTSDISAWHLDHADLKKIVALGEFLGFDIGLSLDWYQMDGEEEESEAKEDE
ncbi:MAG: hypothetical protein ROO73_01025 [Roseivirga sp.]